MPMSMEVTSVHCSLYFSIKLLYAVEAGYIYRVPPLYRVTKGKMKPFIQNDEELEARGNDHSMRYEWIAEQYGKQHEP